MGRRGKPVKKPRLIPAEDAHAMARYFQGTKGTTVLVATSRRQFCCSAQQGAP